MAKHLLIRSVNKLSVEYPLSARGYTGKQKPSSDTPELLEAKVDTNHTNRCESTECGQGRESSSIRVCPRSEQVAFAWVVLTGQGQEGGQEKDALCRQGQKGCVGNCCVPYPEDEG